MNRIPKLCLFAVISSTCLFAQASLGSGAVAGLVHDTYGDGMPDTTIAIINDNLGIHETITTTDDGIFRAASLPPAGGYKLTAAHNGFVDFDSETFTIPPGETVNFRIGLQENARARRGAKRGTSKAGGESDDHQLDIDTPITQRQVDSLPVKERKELPLVLQSVGVSNNTASGNASIIGQRYSNETYTDGLLTSSTYFTEQTPLNDATALNQIDGLQVMVADAPGEFKDGESGIINTVTRTGTDEYHGTAYGYLRLPGLTAVGREALGHTLLHARNQTGANVSGPILSDKLFFFANLEVLNDHFDGVNRINNPLITDPAGNTVLAANCKASATACTNAIKFIQSQMNVLLPLSQRSLNGLAKLDYQFDGNNRVTLSGDVANAHQPNGQEVENAIYNGGLLGNRSTRDDSRFFQLAWITTPAPSVLNELRLGFTEDHIFVPNTYSNLSTGQVAISLYGANVGNSVPGFGLFTEHHYQLFDNFTASGGPNTWEFGVDWARTHYYIDQLANDGEYFYSSLTNFATDFGTTTGKTYTHYTQSFGIPKVDLPYHQFGVYGGDTLRLNPKFTVSFYLRWEKPGNPQPNQNYINGAYYQTASIASPNLDLMPRIGAAYQFNSKTTFRMGYGYFFSPFYGQLLDALYLGNDIYQNSIYIIPTQTNSPAFPKTIISPIPGNVGEVMYSIAKLRNPKTEQLNIGMERELPFNTTLSVNAINVRGYRLWTATDDNLAAPTKTGTYTIDDANGNKAGTFLVPIYTARNDNSYSHVYDVQNAGSSWYRALAVQVRKRMSYGLTLQAAYTWSHAIDTVNGPLIQGGVPLIVPNTYNSSNKDSSTTDQRQRFTLNATWSPRTASNDSFVKKYLINGWQLSTLGTIATGLPETPEAITTGQQLSGITPLYSSTLNGAGDWDRVPFLPVAYLRTARQYNWNVRFSRELPFTERVRGMVMFEVFNLLNSQWNTAVSTIAYTATAGILHPVSGLGNGIAAGSYPYQTNARSAQVAFRVTF